MNKFSGERKFLRWLSYPLISALVIQIPYFPLSAYAGSDVLDPSGIDSRALGTANLGCANVCMDMMTGPEGNQLSDRSRSNVKNGYILKGWDDIFGSGGGVHSMWDNEDDRWCANHGEETNHAIQNQYSSTDYTAPGGGDVPITQICPYRLTPSEETSIRRLYASDKSGASEMCDQVKKKLLLCKFRNTQLESYCLAYLAAEQDIFWQWILVAADAAAATLCGAECTQKIATVVPTGYCNKAACIASSTEALGAIFVENSVPGRMTKGAIGGYGTWKKCTKWSSSAEASAPGSDDNVLPPDYGHGDGQPGDAVSDNSKKEACTAAITFALLGGIRAYNIKKAGDTKDSACSSINSLISDAKITDPNGSPSSDYGNSAPSGYDSEGNFPTGPDSNNVGTYGDQGGSSIVDENGDGCDDRVTTYCSNALDAQMLSPGLGKQVKPELAKIPKDAFLKKLNNQGFGNLLAGMSGGELGEFGSVLSKIGDAAQKEGVKSNVDLGVSATPTSAGGGSKSGSGTAENKGSLFGSMFGNGGPAPAGASTTQFGGQKEMDIWHSGSPDNLFQIVSKKIGTVSKRVK